MNRKQRMQNRETAEWLRHQQRCPNCGERGLHYVQATASLLAVLSETPPEGFWTCPMLYGEDGRRLEAA